MAFGRESAKRIEVEKDHLKLRFILAAIAIIIALVAFGYGIHALLNRNSGWQTIEAYPSGADCSGDFSFQYYFEEGTSATAQYKAVGALYTVALEEAYQLFYAEEGLADINARPNTAVEIAPALYRALEMIQSSRNRCLYLAPVYEEYKRVFLVENEMEASRYDPGQNDEIGTYVAEIAAFANDSSEINLELLGSNSVCLKISDAYLSFAKENGITVFLDFDWMKNAFIVDYVADAMVENGYSSGYIASYDGFTRNLDNRGLNYSFNLFDRIGNQIYRPAVLEYTAPMSIVYLRNYPLSDADRWHYFSFPDGRITTAFVDPQSGMNKSATDNLVAYSEETGCAEILLNISPIYLTDQLNVSALETLSEKQVYALWFENTELKHTQDAVSLTATEDAVTGGYQIP